MRRSVDADKLMDGLGRLATDTDLCKRYGNCTPWIPYSAVRKLISDMILETKESCDDAVSRKAMLETIRIMQTYKLSAGDDLILINKAEVQTELMMLPPAQPDAITASLEELINDYGEDGYFIVDGVNYQANELLNELKINSSVGEKFRIQITKTIVAYFMKFGD